METDNGLSRREALIKLLRVAGAGAGAAGLGVWLSDHSWRPETALAMTAKRGHTVAVDPKLPEMAIIQGDDPHNSRARPWKNSGACPGSFRAATLYW